MPPLTLETAGALVPGGVTASDIEKEKRIMQAQTTQPQTLSVRVLRPFYFGGKPTKVNETIDLPRIFAQEMKAAHKVLLEVPFTPKLTWAYPRSNGAGLCAAAGVAARMRAPQISRAIGLVDVIIRSFNAFISARAQHPRAVPSRAAGQCPGAHRRRMSSRADLGIRASRWAG